MEDEAFARAFAAAAPAKPSPAVQLRGAAARCSEALPAEQVPESLAKLQTPDPLAGFIHATPPAGLTPSDGVCERRGGRQRVHEGLPAEASHGPKAQVAAAGFHIKGEACRTPPGWGPGGLGHRAVLTPPRVLQRQRLQGTLHDDAAPCATAEADPLWTADWKERSAYLLQGLSGQGKGGCGEQERPILEGLGCGLRSPRTVLAHAKAAWMAEQCKNGCLRPQRPPPPPSPEPSSSPGLRYRCPLAPLPTKLNLARGGGAAGSGRSGFGKRRVACTAGYVPVGLGSGSGSAGTARGSSPVSAARARVDRALDAAATVAAGGCGLGLGSGVRSSCSQDCLPADVDASESEALEALEALRTAAASPPYTVPAAASPSSPEPDQRAWPDMPLPSASSPVAKLRTRPRPAPVEPSRLGSGRVRRRPAWRAMDEGEAACGGDDDIKDETACRAGSGAAAGGRKGKHMQKPPARRDVGRSATPEDSKCVEEAAARLGPSSQADCGRGKRSHSKPGLEIWENGEAEEEARAGRGVPGWAASARGGKRQYRGPAGWKIREDSEAEEEGEESSGADGAAARGGSCRAAAKRIGRLMRRGMQSCVEDCDGTLSWEGSDAEEEEERSGDEDAVRGAIGRSGRTSRRAAAAGRRGGRQIRPPARHCDDGSTASGAQGGDSEAEVRASCLRQAELGVQEDVQAKAAALLCEHK